MKVIINSYSQSVTETHVQIEEVSARIHTLKHSCGWSRCLVDLRLCSLGSLCVISISVIFDLTNHLTENQEMVHSALYAKQLKTDQNSLSAYLKHLHKSKHRPNSVSDELKAVCFWKSLFRF